MKAPPTGVSWHDRRVNQISLGMGGRLGGAGGEELGGMSRDMFSCWGRSLYQHLHITADVCHVDS